MKIKLGQSLKPFYRCGVSDEEIKGFHDIDTRRATPTVIQLPTPHFTESLRLTLSSEEPLDSKVWEKNKLIQQNNLALVSKFVTIY